MWTCVATVRHPSRIHANGVPAPRRRPVSTSVRKIARSRRPGRCPGGRHGPSARPSPCSCGPGSVGSSGARTRRIGWPAACSCGCGSGRRTKGTTRAPMVIVEGSRLYRPLPQVHQRSNKVPFAEGPFVFTRSTNGYRSEHAPCAPRRGEHSARPFAPQGLVSVHRPRQMLSSLSNP